MIENEKHSLTENLKNLKWFNQNFVECQRALKIATERKKYQEKLLNRPGFSKKSEAKQEKIRQRYDAALAKEIQMNEYCDLLRSEIQRVTDKLKV